jgi:hypothetical protein
VLALLCCVLLWCAAACSVHVPYVYEAMSSPRVLVMEFIDGVQVKDKEGLQVRGIDGVVQALIVCWAALPVFIHAWLCETYKQRCVQQGWECNRRARLLQQWAVPCSAFVIGHLLCLLQHTADASETYSASVQVSNVAS